MDGFRKVSVCMAVWNTSHLLKRSLHTYTQQTFKDFEIIIIDDNSEDDVMEVVRPYQSLLDIKVHRFEHDFGMRGNTTSFNTAFSLACGQIIFENTPEIMLYPRCIEDMINALGKFGPKSWVSIRTYNITPEDQLKIDSVDWKSDVRNLHALPNFNSPWTQNNAKQAFFGTHQTCVFYRDDWFRYWRRYPAFLDYGTDDPWNAGIRRDRRIASLTIEPFVYHQWHAPIGFWLAHGKAPHWNLWGHTLKNYHNDPELPEGGTAEMWDKQQEGGHLFQMTEENAAQWRRDWDEKVVASGFRYKDGRSLIEEET